MTDPGQGPETPDSPAAQGRQPIFLLPGSVTVLIGVLVAIQLADTLVFNEFTRQLFTVWFAFIPARLLASESIPGGLLPLLWTPFTHAFLHAGFEHLLLNSAWLAIFATPVARRYGAWPTLAIFLLSAAAGAIAFGVTTLPEIQILVGASGGVSGLTGAAVRFIFQPLVVGRDPDTEEPVVLGRHLASLRQLFANPRSRNFTLFWIILNAAVPLLPAFTGAPLSVAWQAHLGGFVAGLLLAPLFERRG